MANGELFSQSFPAKPYKIDVTANPGPIQSVLIAAEQAITNFQSAVTALQQQLCLATATGAYLRNIAPMYGIPAGANETDAQLRARCQAAITQKKLTCPAIAAFVLAWLQSHGGNPPTSVEVFDLQTDPVKAAIFNLQPCQFVIYITFPETFEDSTWLANDGADSDPDGAWYLNFCYLGYGGYQPPDELRREVLKQWKAAGYQPIWYAIQGF